MSMADSTIISVIVPVFNTAENLNKCIDSILSNTYNDFELILVDDGSTDNSGTICDEYAACDIRIRVIHQVNQGEIAARATGIRLAKGQYLYFVDSDDTIETDTLTSIISFADDSIDIVVFESPFQGLLNRDEYTAKLLSFKLWNVWGKLYKKSLFDEFVLDIPRYFKVGGDFLTNLKIVVNVKGKILCKDIHKYHYRIDSPTSVQVSHKSNYDYEKNMVETVSNIVTRIKNSPIIGTVFLKWRITYLGGVIGYNYNVNYDDKWIKDLKEDSTQNKLSIHDRIVVCAIHNKSLRLVLIFERNLRRTYRKLKYRFRLLRKGK